MTSKILASAAIGALASLCMAFSAHAEDRLQPGSWIARTTSDGQLLNDPVAVCITPEGAKTSNGPDEEVRKAIVAETTRNGCRAENIIIDGPRIAFTSICGGMSSQTDIVYSGTHYEGTMTIGERALTIVGERSGDCS